MDSSFLSPAQAVMASASLSTLHCTAATFGTPTLYGGEILSVLASLVSNYSRNVPEAYNFNHPGIDVRNASFCNVTVTYTHPGQNDNINVEAWLPIDNWNGRFQAIGGGGWVAGRFILTDFGMSGAIGEGYATITTDAGLGIAMDPSPWALLSPGNLDLYALQNLGSVSLNDMAVLGKALIQSFYGRQPEYSYWSGCSQGGRQGMMLAQRYPDAFDGIVAAAPAISFPEFVAATFWPQLVMNLAQEYPYPCELDAILAATIEACDAKDGVKDGIISDPEACGFDPFSLVGTVFHCSTTGTNMTLSTTAAMVANASWSGATSLSGRRFWYGPNIGSDLTGNLYGSGNGIADTVCSDGVCAPKGFSLATQWLQYFMEKNASFDYSHMTHRKFDALMHASAAQFGSTLGTSDPDLSEFRDQGGKLLSYHGLVGNP
jgi:hypothetical protein